MSDSNRQPDPQNEEELDPCHEATAGADLGDEAGDGQPEPEDSPLDWKEDPEVLAQAWSWVKPPPSLTAARRIVPDAKGAGIPFEAYDAWARQTSRYDSTEAELAHWAKTEPSQPQVGRERIFRAAKSGGWQSPDDLDKAARRAHREYQRDAAQAAKQARERKAQEASSEQEPGVPTTLEQHSEIGAAMRCLRLHGDLILLAERNPEPAAALVSDPKTGIWTQSVDVLRKLISQDTDEWYIAASSEALASGNQSLAWECFKAARYLKSKIGSDRVIDMLGAAAAQIEELGEDVPSLTRCRYSELDSDTSVLGAPNGVIDLDSGAILPPAEARKRLVTRTIADPYDPTAHHPLVDEILSHLPSDEADWLGADLGYSLRGRPSRRIVILEGPPNSGKTTVLGAATAMLGDESDGGYGVNLSETALVADRHSSANAHSEHLVGLPVGRIAFASDLPKQKMDDGRLKRISGGDPLKVRGMREKNAVSRPASASLYIALNLGYLGYLDLGDEALLDRIRLVKMPKIPGRLDESVVDRVKSDPAIRQAMAAWLVRLCVANPTRPAPPASILQNTGYARSESLGDFGQWIDRFAPSSDTLTVDAVWASATAFARDTEKPFGFPRSLLIREFRRALGLPQAKNVRDDGGEVTRGWRGWTIAA